MAEKGHTYKAGNVDENGDYLIGKGKPPESSRFRKGDERPRGRRSRGTKNFATELDEVLNATLSLTIDGKRKRVSRRQAILLRALDNACRGQGSAMRMALELIDRQERQQQGRAEEIPCDYSVLTDAELDELERLLCKVQGLPPPDVPDQT